MTSWLRTARFNSTSGPERSILSGSDSATQRLDPSSLDALISRHGKSRVLRQLDAMERHGAVIDDPSLWLRIALERDFKFVPIEAVSRCVCGNRSSERLGRFIFWNLLGLRKCAGCGLVYVSPRLTPEAMRWVFSQRYFRLTDVEHWAGRRIPVFKDVLRLIRRYDLRTLLDVGAAYGHFVKWLESRGISAWGCDISEAAVEWGRTNLRVNLFHGDITELDLDGHEFDGLVSLDTLYYAPDPAAQLDAMRRLLRPGGVVILRLRTNLLLTVRARCEGRKPVGKPILPVPHLWGFTPGTIRSSLERFGFEPVVLEAAAYSRSVLDPLHRLGLLANRVLESFPFDSPPLTHSFNVVAVRRS